MYGIVLCQSKRMYYNRICLLGELILFFIRTTLFIQHEEIDSVYYCPMPKSLYCLFFQHSITIKQLNNANGVRLTQESVILMIF